VAGGCYYGFREKGDADGGSVQDSLIVKLPIPDGKLPEAVFQKWGCGILELQLFATNSYEYRKIEHIIALRKLSDEESEEAYKAYGKPEDYDYNPNKKEKAVIEIKFDPDKADNKEDIVKALCLKYDMRVVKSYKKHLPKSNMEMLVGNEIKTAGELDQICEELLKEDYILDVYKSYENYKYVREDEQEEE